MQDFAVLGNPIDHSLSPIIHQCFAKQAQIEIRYRKIRAEMHNFEQVLSDFFSQGGSGLNITLPFKQNAFALAQDTKPRAILAAAANTLWMSQGVLCADNTDGIGLIRDLNHHIDLEGMRVLVVGAGGAARGIIHPLLENNPKTLVVTNRSAHKAYAWQQSVPQVPLVTLNELNEPFDVVINATSASLNGALPALPSLIFSQKPFCYDLSYHPSQATIFVEYARQLGCGAVDGLGMLVEQAAEAFFIWHHYRPETHKVVNFLRSLPKKIHHGLGIIHSIAKA